MYAMQYMSCAIRAFSFRKATYFGTFKYVAGTFSALIRGLYTGTFVPK